MEQELHLLADLSRHYGSDPALVFLGGGNTSVKNQQTLYIKPSGVALATIQADQFLALDRAQLQQLFSLSLPADVSEREAAVARHLVNCVQPPAAGRPSVEAALHEVISWKYVVHLHPTLVNGMTCSQGGKEACAKLFPEALWLDYCDPGYTLSMQVQKALAEITAGGNQEPQMIFLQNHGVFVGADTTEEIVTLYDKIMTTLQDAYAKARVTMAEPLSADTAEDAAVLRTAPPLRTLLAKDDSDKRAIIHSLDLGTTFAGPLTPDHIVYAGSFAYHGDGSLDDLQAWQAQHGCRPKVLSLPEAGVFTVGTTPAEAAGAKMALENARQVESLTTAFGGPRYLTAAEYRFIEQWEMETYRRQVSITGAAAERLAGKVCVITGGAQGFGLGIAEQLAAAGGIIVLADLNLAGAEQAATKLQETYGVNNVIAMAVNVADEDSVAALTAQVTRQFGGLDLLVANAGVLRAGSVKSLSRADWDFVTEVNYSGYFFCVKHAAAVMSRQIVDGKGGWSDIVQINSKSGLEGSNRNGAYAGSKFGAIGLTQSFALELVEDCIKVNSVCPGNYYDGPLWSHPERGLFVQYLASGKVPGAKNVDDVRKFYEAKVPMRRGCMPEDVAKAIIYCVEQKYETGQAIPVTGGQVMLH